MSSTPPRAQSRGSARPACGPVAVTVVRRHREPGHHCGSWVTEMHEYFTRTVMADRRTRYVAEAEAHRSSGAATSPSPGARPSCSGWSAACLALAGLPRSPCPSRPPRRPRSPHRRPDTFAGRARTHGSAAHHQEPPTRGPRRVWGPSAKIRDHHDPIRRTPRRRRRIATEVESVMAGEGFYSAHSQSQHVAAAVAFPYLAAAAESVPLPSAGAPVTIGDFGCAGGANEMAPMALAIDTLRKRTSAPVEIVHTDLPQNDFGSLFELLGQSLGLSGRTAGRSTSRRSDARCTDRCCRSVNC